MLHLHPSQLPSYHQIRSIIQSEIKQDCSSKEILQHILIAGQEQGFCMDELWQMIDLCLDEEA